jgi:hypothetical protein
MLRIFMHPLVAQLRFTRSEFQRGLAGLKDEDARKRFLPMIGDIDVEAPYIPE